MWIRSFALLSLSVDISRATYNVACGSTHDFVMPVLISNQPEGSLPIDNTNHLPLPEEIDPSNRCDQKQPHNEDSFEDLIDSGDFIDEDYFSELEEEVNHKILSSRKLSANSATISNFAKLDCNPEVFTNCDILVSNNLPSSINEVLTVPCGQCYTFDIDGNVTLAGGIDIKGKLLFPLNHKVTIYTPYVIVQGELEINVDHLTITPDNMGANFILTGTDDVLFSPSDSPNENSCFNQTNNICNLGPKPFVVAGGKVSIHGMPESCQTHTPVLKKVHKDPVFDPDEFPTYVTLPDICSQSEREYISYNFETTYGNWTGREGGFMVLEDGTVKVTNRLLSDRGPYLDLTPINPSACLVPDQEYLMVAR